jgi:hypothetical protein
MSVAITLRDVVRLPPRTLLQGGAEERGRTPGSRRARLLGLSAVAAAAALLVAAVVGRLPQAAAFFGAGALALAGGLLLLRSALGGGLAGIRLHVTGLGLRSAAVRAAVSRSPRRVRHVPDRERAPSAGASRPDGDRPPATEIRPGGGLLPLLRSRHGRGPQH